MDVKLSKLLLVMTLAFKSLTNAAVYNRELHPILIDREVQKKPQYGAFNIDVDIQDVLQKNAMKPMKNEYRTSVPTPKLISQNTTEETSPIISLAKYRHTYESNQGPLIYNIKPIGSAQNKEAWVDSYLLRQLLRNHGRVSTVPQPSAINRQEE